MRATSAPFRSASRSRSGPPGDRYLLTPGGMGFPIPLFFGSSQISGERLCSTLSGLSSYLRADIHRVQRNVDSYSGKVPGSKTCATSRAICSRLPASSARWVDIELVKAASSIVSATCPSLVIVAERFKSPSMEVQLFAPSHPVHASAISRKKAEIGPTT